MEWWLILLIIVGIIAVLSLTFQVVIPLFKGQPAFQSFRGSDKAERALERAQRDVKVAEWRLEAARLREKAALNHFTQVLSVEEQDLICLAVRPGMVDTDMQADIREQGGAVMTAEQIDFYSGFKERGELLSPHIPAKSIAWLAIAAPARFNGDFLDADDPYIVAQAEVYAPEVTR